MNSELLIKLGLTKSQAQTYIALVRGGELSPAQLAKQTGESRTAAYAALDKLVEIGLATQNQDSKTKRYVAASPAELERFIEQQRKQLSANFDELQANMPQLLTYYYSFKSEPGVKFYQGKDALIEVYKDQLRSKKDVYLVRTPADEKHFGHTLYHYMKLRAQQGQKAHIIAPDLPGAREYSERNDKELKREISWVPAKSYTAPVEISIYGSKVAFISFGEELLATIIDSPQIAEAMRQVFELAKRV